jgi:hypothetical protein
MTTLGKIDVQEVDLEKLRDLAKSGERPLVPYTANRSEMEADAFRKRGEILKEIDARLSKLLDSDSGNGKESEP